LYVARFNLYWYLQVDYSDLSNLLNLLFRAEPWPKPLHQLQGLNAVRQGEDIERAARAVGTTAKALQLLTCSRDPAADVLRMGIDEIDDVNRKKAKQALGQMLLGQSAERAFERIYSSEVQPQEFELRDVREGRTDTDYRLLNGKGRPVYRINIKFHGALFRRAPEMVGLEPSDCFALATYKIHSALQKQEDEQLPYFFAIVGVRHLSGESVGNELPRDLVEAAALIHQAPKGPSVRNFEDRIVDHLVRTSHPVYMKTFEEVLRADWYILSARRADQLLRRYLFERVYALKVRNFARAFSGAEVDMHFSLSRDLIPLKEFLEVLRDQGSTAITTRLERGGF